MVLYNERKTVTCRSQVKNPAGLHRFTSPHPSHFFWNFVAANEPSKGWGKLIKGRGLSTNQGLTGPCRSWFFFKKHHIARSLGDWSIYLPIFQIGVYFYNLIF